MLFHLLTLSILLLLLQVEALIPTKLSSTATNKLKPQTTSSRNLHPNDGIGPALFMTQDDSSEDGLFSTQEIVAQLDARGIRYSPSASRHELEQLLVEAKEGLKVPTDLPTIIRDLAAKGVRIPRYASRNDLCQLWIEHSHKPKRRMRRRHRPIREILLELDQLGIDYPPGASPRTLEMLLEKYRPKHDDSPYDEEWSADGFEERVSKRNRGRKDLLEEELQQREIRFSRSTTRQVPEELFADETQDGYWAEVSESNFSDDSEDFSIYENPSTNNPNEVVDTKKATSVNSHDDNIRTANEAELLEPDASRHPELELESLESDGEPIYIDNSVPGKKPLKPTQRRSPRTRRLKNEKTKDSVWSNVSDKFERVARKARYATRSARDFWAEDENGIRDAKFEYVKRDNIVIDVTGVDVEEHIRSPQTTRYKRKPNHHSPAPRRRTGRTSSSRVDSGTPKKPGQDSRTSNGVTSPTRMAADSPLFRLPPAEYPVEEDLKSSSKASRTTGTRKGGTSKRRIYSPYNDDDVPTQMYRDSIDRLGEFFVNTADTILWGKLDDEEDDAEEELSQTANAGSSNKRQRNGKSKSHRKDVHWRDRLEERFDSMLGIHENGDFYSRWAEEEGEENGEGGENGAPRRRKARVYDKPFWAVENFVSGLFGRKPPRGYSRVGPGNLLPLIKATTKSLLLLGNNACEWASVRGSIPQPVVVVGVTSCFLSARPGKRLMILGIALVAFRIFGELIHEGMYGNEGWEESEEDEDNASNDDKPPGHSDSDDDPRGERLE